MEWIVQLPVLLFSLAVHELSTGLAAFAKGDRSAEEQGRLTLNPIPHVDPFGTIFVPLLCFSLRLPMLGWAKPVPVDAVKLSRPRDVVEVAAAGPCAHLALALTSAVCFKVSAAVRVFSPAFERVVLDVLVFGVSLNLVLAFFQLLPVAPLDGSRVVSGLLPSPLRARYERHAPYAGYLLAGLLAARLLDPVVMSPARAALGVLARLGLIHG